jgi:small subunit ribosomal protein S1
MVKSIDLETEGFDDNADDFASMLEDSFKKRETSDDFIDGVIAQINEDRVLVDVGKKEEGELYLNEIQDENGNFLFKEGDKIAVVITGYKGEKPRVSHKAALANKVKQEFIQKHKDDFESLIVTGKIIKKNKGGYVLLSDGIEFFLPRSQAMLRSDANNIGKSVEAKVIKIEKNNVVVSRVSLIKEKQSVKEAKIKELIDGDLIVEGTVKNIVSYGMFVDIGENIIGLVHYNEISYKGAVNPSKYFKVDDIVNVKIVEFDNKKGHLSLSIKATMSDPWEDISDLGVGDVIAVTVSNIEPYGVFVDLGNDIEGFLHISEISWDKSLKHPKDILEVNQEINVEVIEIDKVKKKLRVSYKTLQEKPIALFSKKYKKGEIVKGKIVEIKDFGAFINIDGVEGLLANQNCDWQKNKKCKDILTIGDEIEVKIVDLNIATSRISLSLKELKDSPAGEFGKKHKVNNIIKATIKEKKDFGIFVDIDGFEALLRNDDLYPLNADELNTNDEIEAVVTLIDNKENRIRISVKRLEKQKEREVLDKINGDDKMTLGDILKDKL